MEIKKKMGSEDQVGTNDFDSETEQGMGESDNELLEETDKESKLRPIFTSILLVFTIEHG